MVFVLVGSAALYPSRHDLKDIDLLVPEDLAPGISKEGKIKINQVEYPDAKLDLMVFKPGSTYFQKIYDFCQLEKKTASISFLQIGVNHYQSEVMVAPQSVLYAMKASHIHRIIPHSVVNSVNINAWHRSMEDFTYLHQNLEGNLREVINQYFDQGGLSQEISDSFSRDCLEITKSGFEYINHRYGDTLVSMNQTDKDFFNDNVKRYIDHDLLHTFVCQENSGVKTPYYLTLKSNDYVSLEKEKFDDASPDIKKQVLREEIIVLLLERKMLPTVIEILKGDLNRYISDHFESDLREIVAVFSTNLCGSGLSWLRWYALTHYPVMMDISKEICIQVAKRVLDEINITYPEPTLEVGDLLSVYHIITDLYRPVDYQEACELLEYDSNYSQETIESILDEYLFSDKLYYAVYEKTIGYIDYNVSSLIDIENGYVIVITVSNMRNKMVLMRVGCQFTDDEKLSVISRTVKVDDYLLPSGEIVPDIFKNQDFDKTKFMCYYRNIYYYSVASYNYCGMYPDDARKMNGHASVHKYLASYGNMPKELLIVMDPICKLYYEFSVNNLQNNLHEYADNHNRYPYSGDDSDGNCISYEAISESEEDYLYIPENKPKFSKESNPESYLNSKCTEHVFFDSKKEAKKRRKVDYFL